ncbi:MAG: WhiB family transcriptional regulator, redox-sensing transcriptional regulator [Acidimicrobiaceae bacterium]|nr:WhiB family transcriptional regulator, redox-sensing transcriptional regulator [Acidimicrobiaceae bacterium]
MFAELFEQAIELDHEIDWNDARCRDGAATMVGLFFSEQIDDIARAKAICQLCPLMDACFQGALERREPWGVWGGQLFANGKVLAQKRKRGRPPKNPPVQLTA